MTERQPNPFRYWSIRDLKENPPEPWTTSDYSVYLSKSDEGFMNAPCLGTWHDSGATFHLWLREDKKGVLIERYNRYPDDKQPVEYMRIHIESLRMILDKLQKATKYAKEEPA